MSKQIVAIVGRPNVGKSTLFNALAKEKISITSDTPGVTRDRIYADVSWLNYNFTLIDTAGIEISSSDVMFSRMREQAQIAIEVADVIVFLLDGRQGLLEDDYKIAEILRKSGKKIIVVVNKIDNPKSQEMDVYEFYNLGLGDPVPISASLKKGIGDMCDRIVEDFDASNNDDELDTRTKIAIIGKPNAGKSSLINKLLGNNRLIVSDIPGTTRDSVDTTVRYNNEEYVFIDTAGLRRKSKIKEELERFSIIRSVAAIERCDIAILLIDASEGITEQDAKIIGVASARGKGIIIAVNKWDLIEKDNHTVKKWEEDIRATLSFLSYAEIIFISAKTSQRINVIYDKIDIVRQAQTLRVQTGVLNEIVTQAVMLQEPPTDKGKRLKILYATQVGIKPPTFIFFVNDVNLMHFSYKRYLENYLRKTFGFIGTPINIIVKPRKEN